MTDTTQTSGFFERGGAWVLAQFALILVVIALGVLFHGDWTCGQMMVAGAILFALGGVFGVAGAVVLGRNRTPLPKPCEGSELIQNGIYARVRHPLYTSVMLASLGWALIWQSWASLAAALFLILLLAAKARREERWLREKFPAYANYAKQVPRFIPKFRRASQVCL